MVQRSSGFHTLIVTTFCLLHKQSKTETVQVHFYRTLIIQWKFLFYKRIIAQKKEVVCLRIISLQVQGLVTSLRSGVSTNRAKRGVQNTSVDMAKTIEKANIAERYEISIKYSMCRNITSSLGNSFIRKYWKRGTSSTTDYWTHSSVGHYKERTVLLITMSFLKCK